MWYWQSRTNSQLGIPPESTSHGSRTTRHRILFVSLLVVFYRPILTKLSKTKVPRVISNNFHTRFASHVKRNAWSLVYLFIWFFLRLRSSSSSTTPASFLFRDTLIAWVFLGTIEYRRRSLMWPKLLWKLRLSLRALQKTPTVQERSSNFVLSPIRKIYTLQEQKFPLYVILVSTKPFFSTFFPHSTIAYVLNFF